MECQMKHEVLLDSGAKAVTEITVQNDPAGGVSEFIVQYVVDAAGVTGDKTCSCTCGTTTKTKTCKNGKLKKCFCGPKPNTVKEFECE